MNLHYNLQKILLPKHLLETKDKVISLQGGDKKNRYTVKLTGVKTENISVIDFGKNPHSSLINNKEKNAFYKICDYLILIPQQDNKVTALLCELKKTYKKGNGERQLYSSLPLVDYIKSMLETHFEQKYKFNYQFIIIANKSAERFDKQKTRPNPIKTINCEKIKIGLILGATIPFKSILES
ncbi:MAG: hypothetical protein JRJ44_05230 [Deltaproteobacteria bacterium]|nr:hypothetical protein [Deltaproteobacteria bacterium]